MFVMRSFIHMYLAIASTGYKYLFSKGVQFPMEQRTEVGPRHYQNKGDYFSFSPVDIFTNGPILKAISRKFTLLREIGLKNLSGVFTGEGMPRFKKSGSFENCRVWQF